MNQYLFLRRMRGPIFLLTFGITAILDVYTPIDYGKSWPLYLIVWGLLKVAENAILAQNPPLPPAQWPGAPGYGTYPDPGQPGYQYSPAGYPQPGYPPAPSAPGAQPGGSASTTAIVPSPGEEKR
jgi:hypothetical protein